MLWLKLPFDDRIHPQSNKFATSVENKAMGDSNLNDNHVYSMEFNPVATSGNNTHTKWEDLEMESW